MEATLKRSNADGSEGLDFGTLCQQCGHRMTISSVEYHYGHPQIGKNARRCHEKSVEIEQYWRNLESVLHELLYCCIKAQMRNVTRLVVGYVLPLIPFRPFPVERWIAMNGFLG